MIGRAPKCRPRRGRTAQVAAALAALLLALTTSRVARAQLDEQSELDKARNAYLAHQYDEADTRFATLLDPKSPVLHDRVLMNQGRMYWGAVMLAKKRPASASEQFEALLLSDPTYEPDPLAFPTDVINAFIDTRARIRERLNQIAHEKALQEADRRAREEAALRREALRQKMLEKLAGQEKVIATHSRWIALLPFGVGQFQNGQRALGWSFLGLETALVTAAAITLPIYLVDLQYRSNAYANHDSLSTNAYIDRATNVRYANIGLNLGFAGVAVLGIVQAQIAFVPEEAHLLRRPIPDVTPAPPSVSFQLAPVFPVEGRGGGMMMGMGGRF
jgi:hypothetical protein